MVVDFTDGPSFQINVADLVEMFALALWFWQFDHKN